MKILKKAIVGVMCLTMITPTAVNVFANNSTDTAFTVPYSGDPFGYEYSTSWHTLSAGKCDYFKNNAHKLGYSATYLSMSSTDHKKHTYKGVWSPDNMSGFGEK